MPKKSEEEKQEEPKEKKTSKVSQEEFEKKVLELAKKGLTSEKIGEELRKQKIHPKDHNKKISQILKGAKLYIQPDVKNIEEKLERVKKHHTTNKQDKRSMREKDRVFSQLRKLKAYFKILAK